MENKNIHCPEVIFENGWLLDSSISDLTNFELKQEAQDEIESRLSEFQSAWDDTGKSLLMSAMKEGGLCFKEKDIKASLIFGQMYSMSHPLILNVKYYLKSLQEKPHPMEQFVEQAFHELLHILLQDNLRSWPTPTVETFMPQGFEVVAHLHLMALQKRAHEAIGNKTLWLADWYGHIGDDYAKTWNAVSNEVTYSKLLNEISMDFGRA